MSFIDDSEQNMEKYVSSLKEENKSVPLLKEQTGGSVAGFVGGAGMGIDALFAGPFHPDSGHGSKNKQLLQLFPRTHLWYSTRINPWTYTL